MRHRFRWFTPDKYSELKALAFLWAAFLLVSLLMEYTGTDAKLADYIYANSGDAWALRRNFWTSSVIHVGGKWLSIGMCLIVIGLLIRSYIGSVPEHWRKPLLFLILALLSSTALVATLKQMSAISCPWSLHRYGGDRVYSSIWTFSSDTFGGDACFPAGHASAGYAWVALYFFFKQLPEFQFSAAPRLGLTLGLTMGIIFGVGQQLRGAHFLSHDLWTMMLCWTTSTLLALVFFGNPITATTSLTAQPRPQESR